MVWPIIVLVLISVVVAYLLMKRPKREELPHARYVCDICGDKDCVCHREDAETHA